MASVCYGGSIRMNPDVENENRDPLFEDGYPYKIPEVYLNGCGETYFPQYCFDWDDDSVVVVRNKSVVKYTKSTFIELLAENEEGEIVWMDGRTAPFEECWKGKYLDQSRGAKEFTVEEYDLESHQKRKYKMVLDETAPFEVYDCYELMNFVDNTVFGNYFKIEDGVLLRYFGKEPNLVIPDSVTEIGWYAFEDSKNFEFESITIPKSVIEIRPLISEFCKVKCVKIAEDNPKYYTKDGCLIDKETGTLVWAYAGSQIPDDGSVTKIGMHAFYGREHLESIVIPNTITEIGSSAFSDCRYLKSIVISDSVVQIGAYAFSECKSLEKIKLSNSLLSIANSMFSRCLNLVNIDITDSVKNIEDHAFKDCKSLKEISLPEALLDVAEKSCGWSLVKNGDKWTIEKVLSEEKTVRDFHGFTF